MKTFCLFSIFAIGAAAMASEQASQKASTTATNMGLYGSVRILLDANRQEVLGSTFDPWYDVIKNSGVITKKEVDGVYQSIFTTMRKAVKELGNPDDLVAEVTKLEEKISTKDWAERQKVPDTKDLFGAQ